MYILIGRMPANEKTCFRVALRREEKTMSGFFGVASKEDCVTELFYGVDYHSHLGTRRAGMAVYNEEKGFSRAIHNIENTP